MYIIIEATDTVFNSCNLLICLVLFHVHFKQFTHLTVQSNSVNCLKCTWNRTKHINKLQLLKTVSVALIIMYMFLCVFSHFFSLFLNIFINF
jgi:hypothetical protein